MRVPIKAPTSETSPPKTGITSAIMYAITVHVIVQENQVTQCTKVFEVRCFDPFKMRTKQYLAGSYIDVSLWLCLPGKKDLT
jgi:hypothetical protein